MRKFVRFIGLPFFPSGNTLNNKRSPDDINYKAEDVSLVPAQKIQDIKCDQPLRLLDVNSQLTADNLKLKFGCWFPNYDLLPNYDIFISYRRGDYDSQFVKALFENLSNFTIGDRFRAINTFLDDKRLADGINFQSAFSKALTHTIMAIPIISNNALEK